MKAQQEKEVRKREFGETLAFGTLRAKLHLGWSALGVSSLAPRVPALILSVWLAPWTLDLALGVLSTGAILQARFSLLL